MNPAIGDGGPAFPSSPTIGPSGDAYRPADIGCEGMSLRDYFAAKAMQSLLLRTTDIDGEPTKASTDIAVNVYRFDSQDAWLASISYDIADAMLKARQS